MLSMSVRLTEHGRVTLGDVRIDLVRFREQVFTTGLVTHGRVILGWGLLISGFSTSVKGKEIGQTWQRRSSVN